MTSFDDLITVLEQVPCGIGLFSCAENGKAAYRNDTCIRLMQELETAQSACRQASACGWPECGALPPFSEILRKVRQDGALERECCAVRKDGRTLWVKLSADTITAGGREAVVCTFVDITREKELAFNLQRIAEQAGGICILQVENEAQQAVYANALFYEMLGVSKEEYGGAPSEHHRNALSPEDRQRAREKVKEALASGGGSAELRLHRPDGTQLCVNWNFRVSRQPGSEAFLLLSLVTDLTKQKRAKALLQKERSRYRHALEQTRAAIVEWDCVANTFYCSESYGNYAVSRVDNQLALQGKGAPDTVHPDDRPVLQSFFAKMNAPQARHECILRLKMTDGSYRWSRISDQQILDENGKLLSVLGVIVDINEEMEKSLMLNELVGMLPGGVGVFKCTPAIQCLYFNPALLKLFQLTEEALHQLLASPERVEAAILPPDRRLFCHEVLRKAALGKNINCTFRYTAQSERKGEQVGWLHLSAVKIREEQGCPVYYAIVSEPSDQVKLFKQISEHSLVAELALEAPSGKILYANRAFYALAELEQGSALVGRSCAEVLPAADANALHKLLLHSRPGETIETAQWTSCGKYLELRAHSIRWNEKNTFLFCFSD